MPTHARPIPRLGRPAADTQLAATFLDWNVLAATLARASEDLAQAARGLENDARKFQARGFHVLAADLLGATKRLHVGQRVLREASAAAATRGRS
jgi:hypothetical protein